MPEFTLVEAPDSLAPVLREQTRIGVDTEFMRERTFNAELCLVQVATDAAIYCIDPLAAESMADFWSGACTPEWVLHSARQDMEVVSQSAGRLPGTVFDTQIAAGLIGYPPQIGYANLVREVFDVPLAKSHTRADWSRRPLRESLLEYAAEDVQYLLPLYERLAAALRDRGRLEWAEEDSAALLDPALYVADPAAAIGRLKGAARLRGRRRAAAARLSAWREREAMRLNRPRQWIAKDAVLIEVAQKLPESVEGLGKIEGIAPRLVKRAGRELLREVRASADDDTDYEPPAAPTEHEKALLRRLQAEVAACADDLGIAAELLAPRKELSALVGGSNEEPRVMTGWRGQVVGERLAALLESR